MAQGNNPKLLEQVAARAALSTRMTDTARIDRELAKIAYCRGWVAAFDQTRQNPYIVREYSDAWQRGFQDGIEARRKAEASSVSISIERDADGWPKAMWITPTPDMEAIDRATTYSDCEDCDGTGE